MLIGHTLSSVETAAHTAIICILKQQCTSMHQGRDVLNFLWVAALAQTCWWMLDSSFTHMSRFVYKPISASFSFFHGSAGIIFSKSRSVALRALTNCFVSSSLLLWEITKLALCRSLQSVLEVNTTQWHIIIKSLLLSKSVNAHGLVLARITAQ